MITLIGLSRLWQMRGKLTEVRQKLARPKRPQQISSCPSWLILLIPRERACPARPRVRPWCPLPLRCPAEDNDAGDNFNGCRLLWCEGGDDFLKGRIAAQRIPKRQQFQLTVTDGARRTDGDGKLLAGEIFIANPRGDHCKIRNHERTID